MAFVQNTRSRVHTSARAYYICCNVTAGFILVFGLAFIIAGSILVVKYKDIFYEHISNLNRPSYPNRDIDYEYSDLFDHDYEEHHCSGEELMFVIGGGLLFFGVLFVVLGGICVSRACCAREAAHRDEEYPVDPLQQIQPPYKPQPQYPSQPQYPPQPQYPQQPQNPPAVAAPPPYPQQPPSYEQVVNSQQLPAQPNIPLTAPSAPAADEIKKAEYE